MTSRRPRQRAHERPIAIPLTRRPAAADFMTATAIALGTALAAHLLVILVLAS